MGEGDGYNYNVVTHPVTFPQQLRDQINSDHRTRAMLDVSKFYMVRNTFCNPGQLFFFFPFLAKSAENNSLCCDIFFFLEIHGSMWKS